MILFASSLSIRQALTDGRSVGLADEPQSPAERRSAMRATNPAFIPRNHRVEAVIQAAVQREDFGPFEELLTVLTRPYDDQPTMEHYAEPPQPDQRVTQTFCGT